MRRLVVLAVLAAGPALAQDRPSLLPTRDVDVIYHATIGNRSIDQRWRFQAADQKLRLDMPQAGLYMITDERAHVAQMVDDSGRRVLQMPVPDIGPTSTRPGQTFTRLGPETIIGVPCTEWQTKDTQNQETVVCITADGVLLRARRGASVIVQALKIAYGPVDPAAFVIPPGYKRETPPSRR